MTLIRGMLAKRSDVEGTQLRPARPLLTDSARSRAAAVGVCCAVVVTVLGALFAHQATADWLDHAVDSPIITVLGGGKVSRCGSPPRVPQFWRSR